MRRAGSIALALVAACGHDTTTMSTEPHRFGLTSPAFREGARIPTRHTADGEDVSPALRWEAPPEGTVELALVCHDPDAPRPQGWSHWVMAGLPPTRRDLPEGFDGAGTVVGKNDFDRLGWGGPSPPPGHGVHHYHFVLYALDHATSLRPGATLPQLEAAMRGHVLGKAELMGTYERR